jgi:predicted extracellular nuclease
MFGYKFSHLSVGQELCSSSFKHRQNLFTDVINTGVTFKVKAINLEMRRNPVHYSSSARVRTRETPIQAFRRKKPQEQATAPMETEVAK